MNEFTVSREDLAAPHAGNAYDLEIVFEGDRCPAKSDRARLGLAVRVARLGAAGSGASAARSVTSLVLMDYRQDRRRRIGNDSSPAEPGHRRGTRDSERSPTAAD